MQSMYLVYVMSAEPVPPASPGAHVSRRFSRRVFSCPSSRPPSSISRVMWSTCRPMHSSYGCTVNYCLKGSVNSPSATLQKGQHVSAVSETVPTAQWQTNTALLASIHALLHCIHAQHRMLRVLDCVLQTLHQRSCMLLCPRNTSISIVS